MNNNESSTDYNWQNSTVNPIKRVSGAMRLQEPEEESNTMETSFFTSRLFLYVIIALLSVLSLGLFIGILVVGSNNSDVSPPSGGGGSTLCATSGCITSACDVLHGMDLQQNPCADFYAYSCGKWNEIPDDVAVYGIAEKAEDDLFISLQKYLESSNAASDQTNAMTQTKSFYANCTTDVTDRLKEVNATLNEYGGWPLAAGQPIDLSTMLAKLVSLTATDSATTVFNNGLFSIFVRKNKLGMNTIYLDEPELGLDAHYLLEAADDSSTSNKQVLIYKTFIMTALQIFDWTLSKVQLQTFADDIVNFETRLAKALTPIEERRDKSWDVKTRSLAEVQGYFLDADVQLIDIIKNLFVDNTFTISEPISILLSSAYMNTTVKSITSEKNLTNLANYIMWRYVQFQSWFAGGQLRVAYNAYHMAYTGIVHPPQIEDICVKLTNSLLSFVTARIYAIENPGINVTLATTIAEQVRNQFLSRLQNLSDSRILNQTTVDAAKEKAKAVLFMFAFPKWINDNTSLEKYYDFGDEKLDKGIYENAATMFKLLTQVERNILRNPFDEARWIIAPVSVEAHYDALMNTLTLPLGILQSPYFIPNQLPLSNYARLGVMVARELLHGFNIFGRQLNELGMLDDWWKLQDLIYFNDGVNCFSKQYNKYCPQKSQLCVNGNQTADENIADNGAVLIAFQAAMAMANKEILPGLPDLTDAQMFFVMYASMHCTSYLQDALDDRLTIGIQAPDQYRVQGTLFNSLEFKNSFQCPVNKSDTICTIW